MHEGAGLLGEHVCQRNEHVEERQHGCVKREEKGAKEERSKRGEKGSERRWRDNYKVISLCLATLLERSIQLKR